MFEAVTPTVSVQQNTMCAASTSFHCVVDDAKDIIAALAKLLFLKSQCQKLKHLAAIWWRYAKKLLASCVFTALIVKHEFLLWFVSAWWVVELVWLVSLLGVVWLRNSTSNSTLWQSGSKERRSTVLRLKHRYREVQNTRLSRSRDVFLTASHESRHLPCVQ